MKAILSTTLCTTPGTYTVAELASLPDVAGVPHFVGHPATRAVLDGAGAVYTPGKFMGLEPGESFLAVPLRDAVRRPDTGSVPEQQATAAELRVLLVTRTV